MEWFRYGALALLIPACGGSGSGNATGPDGGATPDGAANIDGGVSTGDARPSDGGDTPGTGTVSNGPGGVPFHVATTVWIGAPDDPSTTVVYVFSNPVDCAKLHPSGWADDGRIPTGTQFLELKLKGTLAPDSFSVLGGAATNLAPHEASVNYSLTSLDGGPSAETISSGGTATLMSLRTGVDAAGTFSIKFATSTVDGSYDAAFCAGGTEP